MKERLWNALNAECERQNDMGRGRSIEPQDIAVILKDFFADQPVPDEAGLKRRMTELTPIAAEDEKLSMNEHTRKRMYLRSCKPGDTQWIPVFKVNLKDKTVEFMTEWPADGSADMDATQRTIAESKESDIMYSTHHRTGFELINP
jgi:hypothetical protein